MSWFQKAQARLTELASMQAGWYEGDGVAAKPEALADARTVVSHIDALHLKQPGIFLTTEGNISIEIGDNDNRSNLEIEAFGGGKFETSYFELPNYHLWDNEAGWTSVLRLLDTKYPRPQEPRA